MWAVGFLEGEGSFGRFGEGKSAGTQRVYAVQVNPVPIYRLQAVFGGMIRRKHERDPRRNATMEWCVSGQRAKAVIEAVFLYLTPKRQRQAWKALGYAAK